MGTEFHDQQKSLINKSMANGHVPGYLFSTHICFCKKCNKLISYPYMRQGAFIKVGTQCDTICGE